MAVTPTDAPLMSDTTAERIVLGVVINNPVAFRDAWDSLPDGLWYDPRHELIAGAITGLYARDLFVDGADAHETLTVAVDKVTRASMAAEGGTDQRRGAIGRLVSSIAVDMPSPALFPRYVDRLVYLTQLRRARAEAVHFLQRIDTIAENDEEIGLTEAVHSLRSSLDEVEAAAVTDVDPPMALGELLNIHREYNWLIPGLFEYGDRLLLTGFEGGGKSELVHQVATMVAGQLHPFTSWPLPAKADGTHYRTMVIDAENSWDQLQRRLRRHTAIVDRCRRDNDMEEFDWTWLTHRISLRPDGLELTNADEVARLSLAMEKAAPDLVVISPLYKLTTADLNDATAVRTVLSALDRLRVRHGCAMLIEHHPGHERAGGAKGGRRALRPAGSSLLMRWPEFGRGLLPIDPDQSMDVELSRWRADREQRVWPDRLVRGGRLPWTPGNDSYYAEADSYG